LDDTLATDIKSCHNDVYWESKDHITPMLSLSDSVGCIPLLEHYWDGQQYYAINVKAIDNHEDKAVQTKFHLPGLSR